MENVTFELDGVEYKLPNFINIDNYVKVFKIKDIFSEEYFAAKLLNILTGAPIDKLLEANYQEVEWLASYSMSLFPKDKPPFKDRFELDGVQYGFIPSWRKLSFAEYVDLDTLITKKPDEVLDFVHIIMAIMYRPIVEEKENKEYKIEKYTQDTLTQRAELFKNKLDINYYISSQFFFIQFAKKYSEHILQSSTMTTWQQMKMVWKNRKMIGTLLLEKDLDGTSYLTKLLPTILQDMKPSSKSRLSKFLTRQRIFFKKIWKLKRKEKR
jgi:hypothetical protein